jgi:ribosomal protein S18 acetylase RimI-like enzyme
VTITVREYRDTDYDACCGLWGELSRHHAEIYEDPSIASGDPGKYFDEYIGRTDRCGTWVAEVDGRVVGFAGLLDTVGEAGVAEIEPVVVSAGFRREAIGSKLVEYAKEEAKKKGFRFISIKPELRNEEAFKLYVRLGFNLVGGVELFQDLRPECGRKWKPGINILDEELYY